jgi:hypothetical protein
LKIICSMLHCLKCPLNLSNHSFDFQIDNYLKITKLVDFQNYFRFSPFFNQNRTYVCLQIQNIDRNTFLYYEFNSSDESRKWSFVHKFCFWFNWIHFCITFVLQFSLCRELKNDVFWWFDDITINLDFKKFSTIALWAGFKSQNIIVNCFFTF